MSGCGKILALPPATIPKCGGFYLQGIAYCENCKRTMDEDEKTKLEIKYLKEKIKKLEEK